MSKNEILKVAAKEFAEKAKKISNIFEIAIVGSVAGNDPYPNDLDIAIVISNLNEIKTLAKYARQMSRHNPSWDVFLFNENLKTIGRLCHRRECPSTSVDCSVPGCGETPHIRMHPDFEYNEMTFFSSPIDVLWTSLNESLFVLQKNKLGIVESRKYSVLEDIKIKCIICGKRFVFTGAERKSYQKQGFNDPKRCYKCRELKYLNSFGY